MAIQFGAIALGVAGDITRHGVRLSNYPYAAAFVENIGALHGAGVAADNSG